MWIISPSSSGSSDYSISSTDNVFTIMFANKSMTLNDAGTDTEHYLFEFEMQNEIIPNGLLTSANVATTCYYNQTMFQGMLYTKMEKTYPANVTASATNTTEAFTPWPYAVKVEQIANAGSGTPTCVDTQGNEVGGDYSVADTTQSCDCLYLNTGT
jgi:hypothetical protein